MNVLIFQFRVAAEHRNVIVERTRELILATRAEEGCVEYSLSEDVYASGAFVFVERWASRAALDAHMKTPHLKTWLKEMGAFLVEPRGEIASDTGREILSL